MLFISPRLDSSRRALLCHPRETNFLFHALRRLPEKKKQHTHNKIPSEGSCAAFPSLLTHSCFYYCHYPIAGNHGTNKRREQNLIFISSPLYHRFLSWVASCCAAAAARRRYMCPWSRRVNFSYSSGFTLRASQQSRSTSLCVALFCIFSEKVSVSPFHVSAAERMQSSNNKSTEFNSTRHHPLPPFVVHKTYFFILHRAERAESPARFIVVVSCMRYNS